MSPQPRAVAPRRPLPPSPAGIAEHAITHSDEVGAGGCKRLHLLQGGGKSDAGDFEYPRPPRHALRDGVEGGPPAGRVRLAEHDVVGAGFGCEHGVVPGRKPAAAGDARRLERRERRPEGVDPVEVRAVGARARREIGMAAEEERRAGVLYGWRERLGVIDLRALVGVGQPQQHGRDVGGAERLHQPIREPGRLLRGHEIEARGGAPRLGRVRSGRHGNSNCPCNRAVWGRLYNLNPTRR